jgi:hypothetical protein
MREKLKKIRDYIFKSWEDELIKPHPGIKLIPPFFFKVITILIIFSILYNIYQNNLKSNYYITTIPPLQKR